MERAAGPPVDAVLYLSAAAGLGNRQSRPRYLLAQVLVEMDDPVLAAAKLREAVELQPAYDAAHALLATLYQDARVIARFGLAVPRDDEPA